MWIHDHTNYAIRGTDGDGFTLANSVVNGANGNNAAPFDDSAVRFTNLTGSASVTQHLGERRLRGQLPGHQHVGLPGPDHVHRRHPRRERQPARERRPARRRRRGRRRSRPPSPAAPSPARPATCSQFDHNGSGAGDLVLTSSTFDNAHPAIATGGGGVTLSNSGTSGATTMDINGNTFRDAVGQRGDDRQDRRCLDPGRHVHEQHDRGRRRGRTPARPRATALKIQPVGQGTSTWTVDRAT